MYQIENEHGEVLATTEEYWQAVQLAANILPAQIVGHDGDIAEGGDRTLCWKDWFDSINDDGSMACGSIRPYFSEGNTE